MDKNFCEMLRNLTDAERVLIEEPMSRHTTFRVGGAADYFVTPSSAEEVCAVVRLCRDCGVPHYILGNGSNLLVSDSGYRGAVICIGKQMSEISVEGTRVTAQAGALLSAVGARAASESLAGFEFAAGIPGTVGGAAVMNAGAYGGELKDVLVSVTALDARGEVKEIPAKLLELGYRTSILAGRGDVVLSAVLRLERGEEADIRERMAELRQKRTSKQPLEYPSAGSTFKRPEGHFAGKLIEDAGLRGFAVGGAQVSEKHCGFVINRGDATASDIRKLICQVSERVEEQFHVKLEPEVKFLGEF